MTPKSKIIIISGATATGKTSSSITLALELEKIGIKAEIINFDSLLFYDEITIGTAKPTLEEQKGVPHHLVGTVSIKQDYNSSHFRTDAKGILNQLIKKNITPILVGGSAFYIRALLKGMYSATDISDTTKEKLNNLISSTTSPGQVLMSYLEKHDSESAQKLHVNDEYRLTRAVEYHLQTNTPFSAQAKIAEKNNPYDLTSNLDLPVEPLHFNLDIPKEEQWPIIQERTKQMISSGLIEEVKELLNRGFDKNLKALRSVGYVETINFIEGTLQSIDELEERINISTRQLAKSQRTFFKKIVGSHKVHPLNTPELIKELSIDFLTK